MAQLTFAVGLVDEPVALRGLCHVVEHLALFQLRHTPIEFSGEVDLETTSFYASGSPARVVAFLADLCAALSDLPLDRLEVEHGVLEAEGGSGCHPVVAALLSKRYGSEYAGVTYFRGPERADPGRVASFASRWFTSWNAALHLDGSPPANLRLPLPAGPAQPRHRPVGRLGTEPVTVTDGSLAGAGSGVLLRLPEDTPGQLQGYVGHILEDRIEEECRHRAGHAYSVHVEVPAAADGVDLAVVSDARQGKEAEVARAVLRAVRDLAGTGPSPAELAACSAAQEEAHATGSPVVAHAARSAMRRLLDLPEPAAPDPRAAAAVTSDQVRAWMREALRSAVFFVDPLAAKELSGELQHEALCGVGNRRPDGRRYRPGLLARAVDREARHGSLLHTATGVAMVKEDGVHVIDWATWSGQPATPRASSAWSAGADAPSPSAGRSSAARTRSGTRP